jgi:CelD/BcsL family acetyltransferase involved in cellulose biosynthesis
MRSTLDYENEFQFQFQLEIVPTSPWAVNKLKMQGQNGIGALCRDYYYVRRRTSRCLRRDVLIPVRQDPKITICRSAEEMLQLRPLWESLCGSGEYTVFQDFDLNVLAAERFASREQPYVVCAENSQGLAIVPAALRHRDGSIRLLGEELFDYRSFLHRGNDEVLRAALAALAPLQHPLEIVALREQHRSTVVDELQLMPFVAAPSVTYAQVTAEQFAASHTRLGRNLRRLERLGFELRRYDGANSHILRSIYTGKAAQHSASLFNDPARIEFLATAGRLMPEIFEIFTLENGPLMAAALVTLREPGCRRFYTGWFAPQYEKHSPALALIYEVTRQSLAAELDCDYMTGEQPYKLRLATSSTPLYCVRAASDELAKLGNIKAFRLPAVV